MVMLSIGIIYASFFNDICVVYAVIVVCQAFMTKSLLFLFARFVYVSFDGLKACLRDTTDHPNHKNGDRRNGTSCSWKADHIRAFRSSEGILRFACQHLKSLEQMVKLYHNPVPKATGGYIKMGLKNWLKHAWSVFNNRDPTYSYQDLGASYMRRPDRMRFSGGNERSIVTSVYNRIAMDCATIDIKHVRIDENGRFLSEIDSGLNKCLSVESNLDQTGRAFKQDLFMSMLDEGCVALVPTSTDLNPDTGSFDVQEIRTGKILEWHPAHVKVRVYNENTGQKEDIIVPKRSVAIIENPLYAVVNEPNSTMQRLVRKLNLLDAVDEQSSSGKLDLIIQLPYIIKTEARRKQAEQRRKSIEDQLSGSKYGIAYTDGTEHVTQLNRPIENNLMKQIEYLTNLMYSQLGMTQTIMDGSADDKTMLNYFSRTIEPLVSAPVDEMKRKFLTKTARSQRQSIMSFRDPFKLVPVNDLAEIADKFTRNEIASSNDIRQIIGWKPSKDKSADELRNKNLSEPTGNGVKALPEPAPANENEEKDQNGETV